MPTEPESLCYREDDPVSNRSTEPAFAAVLQQAVTRRQSLKHLAGWAGLTTLGFNREAHSAANFGQTGLTFRELARGIDETARAADGYDWQVIAAWGDPILPGAEPLDINHQTGESQSKQFGYNCDYIAFLPLPSSDPNIERGLLCVNHEYTDTNLMFPGLKTREDLEALPRQIIEAEMAAMGHSVIEVVRKPNGDWKLDQNGRLNRRLTALATPIRISGPVAGHPRLRTSDDPTGRNVIGTLNNCGGGVTPWGTMLICEENFNATFSGSADATSEVRNHKRYGIDGPSRFSPAWAKHFPRFDIEQEPNEPNRFGWVVEFDPMNPNSQPVKRTALGRCKHEGAGIVTNHDGRVVVYCGDDERFEYVYRFVTRRAFDPANPNANRNLLDDGTLSVAKFDADGTVSWLPLTFGTGPLTPENGFESQADVLIETRRAADLLGATPMDRPEDVEPSSVNGCVYVILSNNSKRSAEQADAANPRPHNMHGHVLELIPQKTESGFDHAADTFQWTVFLRGGDPVSRTDDATCHADVSNDGWVSCPDNAAFDSRGRLWMTTDGASETASTADGIYVCETNGEDRARTRLFFQGPRGSELSGVCLTPDDRSLFVSVQHPGEEDGSDFANPSTRWPDFDPKLPPRPAVVAIRHRNRQPIGSR
jgi:uncharacterized protein